MALVPLWQLTLAAAVQIITLVAWLATLSFRIKAIEKKQQEREPLFERVVKLEALSARLQRLEEKLDKIIDGQLIRMLYPSKNNRNVPPT